MHSQAMDILKLKFSLNIQSTFYNLILQIFSYYNLHLITRLLQSQLMHQLDKFILNKNPEARYKHSLTFSVYNFLAHKNILFVNNKTGAADLVVDANNPNKLTRLIKCIKQY